MALVALLAAVLQVVQTGSEASAVTADQWQAGNIISNGAFFTGSAMTASEVQSFLNAKGANCTDGAAQCLKNYTTSTPATTAEAGLCAAMPATSASTGAQIIYNVGAACGISQKVILVMIQKESSIVTASTPSTSMYKATAGFACPDTAPCDTQYYGFFNQVYRMARQFKYYAANPTRYGYQAGRNNTILYNPNTACGSGTVYIENQATANLYIYTPYQPNKAALANLYGTGDSCSAYGNRNFWRFYNDWFGSTPPPPPPAPVYNPQGSIDSVSTGQDGDLRVQGWAYDNDQPTAPVSVKLSVAGTQVTTVSANQPRSDLAYYGIPGNHGFDVTVKGQVDGDNAVCGVAVNLGGGTDVALDCKNGVAKFNPIDPIGSLDSLTLDANGLIVANGWAYDGSAWSQPVAMMLTINGNLVGYASAGDKKADLAYYGIPGDHGFTTTLTPAVNGNNQVCAYAANILGGTTQMVGCKNITATVPGSPTGYQESVSQDGYGNVTVSGYAYDPSNLYASVVTVISMNGSPTIYLWADKPRPELAYYGVPGNHGYSYTFSPPVTGDSVSVCTYAANIGPGADNPIGCKKTEIFVPGSPIGDLNPISVSGTSMSLSGWAWDVDAPYSPLRLIITVNGQINTYLYADQAEPNLAPYGIPGKHGFSRTLPKPAAGSTVCAYAANEGAGLNRFVGCRKV